MYSETAVMVELSPTKEAEQTQTYLFSTMPENTLEVMHH